MTTTDPTDPGAVVAARLLGRPVRTLARLSGGSHADTTTITDGVDDYVLRRFPPGDPAVANEVAALRPLAVLADLVPALVAYDDGAEPAIITRKLAGTAPRPDLDPERIAVQMGAVLARIHAVDPTGLRRGQEAPPAGDSEIARRALAEWAGLAQHDLVLTHGDFWCGNALWDGEVVSGVVDWPHGRQGPRGLDVAWCRQDLVLLGSRDAADAMLATYRAASGRQVPDIAGWDRRAAAQADPVVEEWSVNYAGIGRGDLTGAVLRQRLDAWVDLLLAMG